MATTKFLTRKIDFSGNKLAFTFDGKPSQMFNPDSLPNGIRSKLVLWGLNEKLGNASANLAKNRETDKAVAVTNRLWEALCAGNWEVTLSAEEREAARLEAIRKEKQQRMLDLIEACRRIGIVLKRYKRASKRSAKSIIGATRTTRSWPFSPSLRSKSTTCRFSQNGPKRRRDL